MTLPDLVIATVTNPNRFSGVHTHLPRFIMVSSVLDIHVLLLARSLVAESGYQSLQCAGCCYSG